MTTTRFLTGSLATLAVASAFTLAGPAAQAADLPERPCGQPEIAAVYETVTLPAVYRTVPAVTHLEWSWQREVPTYEFEFGTVISREYVEATWTREVAGPKEYLFSRKVVDTPGIPEIPAVPEVGHFETVVITPEVVGTEVEYRHENTGNLRWEDADWGAQNGNGRGWVKTGRTREVVVTPAVTAQKWIVDVPAKPAVPAVPEIAHTEHLWALTSPGGDWTGPTDDRPGDVEVETTTTQGGAPAGEGWKLVGEKVIPMVIDLLWATTAPEGYKPTGNSRVNGSRVELSEQPSATGPAGDDWRMVEGSEVVVVDEPEEQVLVTPETTEDRLVTPAVPATEPCVSPPAEEDLPAEPVEDVAAPGQAGAGPVDTVLPNTGPHSTGLPNTGNDVAPWMAPAGLAVMLAGAGVIRLSRRAAG